MAKGGEDSAPVAVPGGYDPAHRAFFQYVDMILYGGAWTRSGVYPNPPMRAPEDSGGGGGGDGDDDDGEHMTEYLERRVAYLESGRAETTTYTLDEYMRYLDEILGG